MKRAAPAASAVLVMLGGFVLAQSESDPITQLRACSLMEGEERLRCLDRLSRSITPANPPGVKEDSWVISQTRSPVDFSPIATATVSSREDAGGNAMQLSIRCRGGRTEIVVAGSAIWGRADDSVLSYRVDGGPPVQLATGAPAFGPGIAFKTDAVALIQTLPSKGELAVHLSSRLGAFQDVSFSLLGLERVRAKISSSCKWSQAIAKPNNW